MITTLLRRITLLLAVLALLSTPLAIIDHDPPVAVADEDKDESGQNEGGDGDDNRGHGNDHDGHDEDNPGRGGGNGDKEDSDDSAEQSEEVVTIDAYTVDVTCEYDDEADETTCTFIGAASEGASDVSHVDVPKEVVCTEVVGGEYEYVDPDPNTRVTGYKSRGSEGTLTLVLAGEVATEGTTTYWIKSDGVFPAEGPALQCDLAAAETTGETSEEMTGDKSVEASFDTTPAAETGSLAIRVYTCSGVPEDRSAFDWFGACDPAGAGMLFSVTPAGATGEPVEMETGPDGALTVDGLDAGTYAVDLVDGAWCHAKSDSVNADSEVIVEAGATSVVWIFTCGEAKTGA